MPFRTLLGLILCNLVWSAHPAMGKLVLADFSPAQAAWLRYAAALAAYVIAVRLLRLKGAFCIPASATDRWAIFIAGFMAFCYSPLLQFTGLLGSKAAENALIVAMEPLFTVVMGWVILREAVPRAYRFSFALALLGFVLLAQIGSFRALDGHVLANALLLVSMLGEATYSVLGRRLAPRLNPLGVFGSALAAGVASLTFALLVSRGLSFFLDIPRHLTATSALGILWLGPLGTSATYLYWMYALVDIPVASAALTLFIQPIFGSVLGYLFLGDRLSSSQLLGGILILAGVLAPTLLNFLGPRSRPLVASD